MALKEQDMFPGIGNIMKVSNKRNKKEHGGRSRKRTDDPAKSSVFVAICWCHVLFVLRQTERTCLALLRKVAPYGLLD